MNRIAKDLAEWNKLPRWQRDLLEHEAREEAELVAADKHRSEIAAQACQHSALRFCELCADDRECVACRLAKELEALREWVRWHNHHERGVMPSRESKLARDQVRRGAGGG